MVHSVQILRESFSRYEYLNQVFLIKQHLCFSWQGNLLILRIDIISNARSQGGGSGETYSRIDLSEILFVERYFKFEEDRLSQSTHSPKALLKRLVWERWNGGTLVAGSAVKMSTMPQLWDKTTEKKKKIYINQRKKLRVLKKKKHKRKMYTQNWKKKSYSN